MKSSTWVSMCYDNVFLLHLLETNSWSKAGFHWRTHFFMRGQLYRDRKSGHVYRALNAHNRICALWPMTQCNLQDNIEVSEPFNPHATPMPCRRPHPITNSCWIPKVTSGTEPFLTAMLDWDDFEAATCEAIPPLGLVSKGCPWYEIPKQISQLQTSDFQHPLAVAAARGFLGCSKDDLLKLAKEQGIHVTG